MKAPPPLSSSKARPHHLHFDLKHKVILSLNKLADRDTCQLAVDDLEKTAHSLSPDQIPPFLSCILDTDKDHKSSVRKECVRLFATLATFHGPLLSPHLPKMLATIVKRLKDPDSVVRDACVETLAVFASKLANHSTTPTNNGVFLGLVKPLFEALGEQNKAVQCGSALCLARVIDNTNDPPLSLLQRMLARTIKLLKNPHFMAKPAVIELNTSIIQAGGAPTQNLLSAAINSIQESLRSSDWSTRKAASVALGEIASTGASCLASLKASCTRSLESCRFDKVKPVRDSVLHALQYWKTLPGPDTPEPSETGSSIKENFCGDYSDITSTSDSLRKEAMQNKVIVDSSKTRIPFSNRKACQNYVDTKYSKADDWNIEIAVPKSHKDCLADIHNEESEGSSVMKTLERMSTDVMSTPDIGCEYVPMDDKQDCLSVSNLAADNFETKFVRVSHDLIEEGGLLKQIGRSQRFTAEVSNSEEQINSTKMHDRRSLDSTVTETSYQASHGCCSQVAGEMVRIQKQLSEIECKQSSLMELLQVFSTGVMESLTVLQSKVSGLEHEVDRMVHVIEHGGRYSDSAISKRMKQNQSVSSPRISTVTPRPSVDIHSRPSSLFSGKSSDIWEEKTFIKTRLTNCGKQDTMMWCNPTLKTSRNAPGEDMQKSSGQGAQIMERTGKLDAVFAAVPSAGARQNAPESKNFLWQRVKGFLSEGDLDSAYAEAICSGNQLVLIELLDRTGPVLQSLSHKTSSDVLSILASFSSEQRFTGYLFPWLQQVVDLSTIHGPDYLVVSPKARREFTCAVQEAVNMEFSNPAERRSITQLALKLCQLWGNT